MALNGDMRERQSIFLAENGFRVICYDRRGFGSYDRGKKFEFYRTIESFRKYLIVHPS